MLRLYFIPKAFSDKIDIELPTTNIDGREYLVLEVDFDPGSGREFSLIESEVLQKVKRFAVGRYEIY